jgi:hypothetical protein
MTHPWAIRLARQDAAAAAGLRLLRGIEAAESLDSLWLRGPAGDETLARALQALPALERFEWLGKDGLRATNSRIPGSSFPALEWQPLAQWAQVELPPAALPAELPGRSGLRLVRSAEEKTANVLLTNLNSWLEFASRAPEIRLRQLRFAASAAGEVIICGTPLPAIPGRRYVEQEGIALPAGFAWAPGVSRQILRQLLQAADDALVLWYEDGSIVYLHPEQLVPASRSGVRATVSRLEISGRIDGVPGTQEAV